MDASDRQHCPVPLRKLLCLPARLDLPKDSVHLVHDGLIDLALFTDFQRHAYAQRLASRRLTQRVDVVSKILHLMGLKLGTGDL